MSTMKNLLMETIDRELEEAAEKFGYQADFLKDVFYEDDSGDPWEETLAVVIRVAEEGDFCIRNCDKCVRKCMPFI